MFSFKKHKLIIVFLVVAFALFFLHNTSWLQPEDNLLWTTVRPLTSKLYSWANSLNNLYNSNKDHSDLRSQVEQLKKKVARLTVVNAQYREKEEENDKLRKLLNFSKSSKFKLVVADVIAKEGIVGDNKGLIIDRGSQDGIKTGLGVISEEGVIVGKVIETKLATAKICLTVNPDCKLAASLQNQDKTQGIVDGDLGLTIKMNYIPQLQKINPGDMVVTSGLGGSIPRGLLIGKVTKVYNASNEVWQEASIEAPINLDNLTIVSVVIP